MKLYTVGTKKKVTYGHGSYGDEIHIYQIDPYSGDTSFHPLFKTRDDCIDYIKKLKYRYDYIPVELSIDES